MEKRMDETMDAEKFLKDLIRRALLGDHEAVSYTHLTLPTNSRV